MKPIFDLVAAIQQQQDIEKQIQTYWRGCVFRKFLIENLNSKKPLIDPPSEEYPRLRSYRGTGPRMEIRNICIRHNSERQKFIYMELETDYVFCNVDIFDESEGCPGASIKKREFHVEIPIDIFENFNSWGEWALKKYNQRINEQIDNAQEVLRELKKRS